MAEKRKKSPWYARTRFLLGMLALVGIIVASRLHLAFSPCVFLRVGPLTLACPLGTLEVNLAGHTVIWSLLPGFLVVCLVIFVFGRMWCGWVCPASLAGGVVSGICSYLLPKPARRMQNGWRKIAARVSSCFTPGKPVFLGFLAGILIGAYMFRYPLWSILCPLGVVSRNLIEGSIFLGPRLDLLFLLLPVFAMLIFRGGWKCACPVGLAHGIAASPGKLLVPSTAARPEACTNCGLCRRVCPAGLDPSGGDGAVYDAFRCTKCLRCMEDCPTGAIKLTALRRPLVKDPPGRSFTGRK